MAKDGTMRGGARAGAGRKSQTPDMKTLREQVAKFTVDEDLGAEIYEPPSPKEYLTAEQKGGGKLCSDEIYHETYLWLKSVGCEKIVAKQLVENYSMAMARHIQCEGILSSFGLLAKHPTTGEPTTSPFVKMSIDYMKQATQLWYQIFSIVKENSAKGQIGLNRQSEVMENLLRRVK